MDHLHRETEGNTIISWDVIKYIGFSSSKWLLLIVPFVRWKGNSRSMKGSDWKKSMPGSGGGLVVGDMVGWVGSGGGVVCGGRAGGVACGGSVDSGLPSGSGDSTC